MFTFSILLFILFQEPQVAQKAAEEFKVELEYKFKNRQSSDNAFIDLTETVAEKERRTTGNTSPLPYLIIHLSFQKLADNEVRIRCTDNNQRSRLGKRVEANKVYTLDLGFTEDMKDRVTSHEYTFVLMDQDRKDISQIVLRVEEDGTFLVNGVRRGKF